MDEETPLSQQKQVSFFHANKNSQLAAIFTFLAQLLKGLLEYRTAAAARTSMRRMIFKKVLELDAGGIEDRAGVCHHGLCGCGGADADLFQ